jgi:alpha-L-fucosidase
MWFDYSYDEMSGEMWRSTDLVRMIRKYQPHAILDNRLEKHNNGHSLFSLEPKEYAGDFLSPEQIIPPEGFRNTNGDRLPWEACITMNRNWGYCASDKDYKRASMLIQKLVECVGKDGNLLLNVGPDARGNFPVQVSEILRDLGNWMKYNAKSIYGCGVAEMPKPENGWLTRNGNFYYYHITDRSVGGFPLFGFQRDQIKKARLLCDGSELPILNRWPETDCPDIAFVEFPCYENPAESINNVIEIELYQSCPRE